jgi:hypothetical protein
MTVDRVTVMSTISAGLKLIEQFGDLAKRFMDQPPQPPAQTVEQAENTMELRHNGKVVQRRAAEELNLNAWDEVRYRALERRALVNWQYFNELSTQLPMLTPEEQGHIRMRMENTKSELCTDLRAMAQIYERTLRMSLPEHYRLHDVCG